MLRIAICEDDENERERLKELLLKFGEDEKVELSFACFGDGMNFIADYNKIYDVVFMDIEMPFMNGMSAAQRLREIDTEVALVFTTRLAHYAVQGYTVDAAGYLLKPLEYFSLSRLMKKLMLRRKSASGHILVKTVGGLVKVDWDGVRYIEVMDHYLLWHTLGGDYRAYGKLSDVEKLLPYGFYRSGKSYIVNFRYASGITKDGITVGESVVPVSKAKHAEALAAFGDYLRGGERLK